MAAPSSHTAIVTLSCWKGQGPGRSHPSSEKWKVVTLLKSVKHLRRSLLSMTIRTGIVRTGLEMWSGCWKEWAMFQRERQTTLMIFWWQPDYGPCRRCHQRLMKTVPCVWLSCQSFVGRIIEWTHLQFCWLLFHHRLISESGKIFDAIPQFVVVYKYDTFAISIY